MGLRRLLWLFVLMGFTGMALAQGTAKESPQRTVTVPLIVEFNRPFVDLQLSRPDGTLRTARFWIDTGGGGFLLSEPLATELGLRPGEQFNDGDMKMAMTSAPKASLGGMPLDLTAARAVIVLGRNDMDDGVPAEGMLPGHVLARYHVVFDYPRGRFTLAEPGVLQPRGTRIASPISEQMGFPRIEVRAGDQTLALLLDTGASFTMISEQQMAKWRWPKITGAFGNANMGTGPYEAEATMLRMPQLRVGEATLRDVPVVSRRAGTFEKYMSSLMTGPIVGALGGNVLRAFRIEIDYPNGATYVEQSGALQPHDLDMAGIILNPEPDGSYLVLDTVKSEKSLRPGDKLLQIDDLAVTGATLAKVIDALRGTPGQTRTVRIERAGKSLTLKVPVQRVL